jgi:putative ABC transport system permease protein
MWPMSRNCGRACFVFLDRFQLPSVSAAVKGRTNARPRFYTLVLTLFSTLALTLAGIGICGIMSYAVTRRITEFGIRMALGAEPAKLFSGVMGQGLLLAAAGAVTGMAGAFFQTRLLEGLVFGRKLLT